MIDGGARRAKRRAARAAIVALAAALAGAAPARAGGPLEVFNQQPVVYPNGAAALSLNLDQGPLGTRSNAQAVTLVQAAVALWNGVATSTARIGIGAALATNYTAANYSAVLDDWTDGLNPVIFDSDGSIVEALYGVGAKSYVLGFAGSAYWTGGPSAGKYAEGQAVLNGAIGVSDATWTVVMAHEFGHLFGLDHAQLDGTQGLAQSNYALMYPIAYRSLISLHEDDAAAATALYPAAGASAVFGQLAGTFTTVAGTPIRGANIWAQEVATGKVYSVVSDFLKQGNGFFRLYLPAGSYTLHAESISSQFYGGSGVGPYANTATDVSFQSPHPIAPVALGGASPQQIVVTAGCALTATFKQDGTGGVTGSCAPPPPVETTYTLTVANGGPSEVTGAIVTAPAPPGLTIGSWTCAVTSAGSGGTVTTACGASSGTGALDTTANLKVGGALTYTIAATVTAAGGSVTYAASVKAPAGTANSGASCTTLTGANARSFDAATGACSASDTDPVLP